MIKKLILPKILKPILEWIANEEWKKLIALGVIIIFILGFVSYEGVSLLGMLFGPAATNSAKIIDLKPASGEIIMNDYPSIKAEYQNPSDYMMKLVINGEDVTENIDYVSDNRLEYYCSKGVIPANYEVRLSFLDKNRKERVAQTARFKTAIYDDFTAGNINWNNTHNWVFSNNCLEGTSFDGEASSIEFRHYVHGNVGIKFDAKIMLDYTGGIGVFFNSFYGVVIGDNDDRMIRIYRDKKVLETSKLQSPLIADNIYSIKIERITRPANILNTSQETVISVYIDECLVATAVDPASLDDSYPLLGLRIWNSKMQIYSFMVYCPEL